MAKIFQAQPGQTFKIGRKEYEADENGVVTVRDEHAVIIAQFGIREVKNVDSTHDGPTPADDKRRGFSIGSIWHSAKGLFRCAANAANAAAWEVIQDDQAAIPDPDPAPESAEDQPVIVTLAVQPENEAAAAAALNGISPAAVTTGAPPDGPSEVNGPKVESAPIAAAPSSPSKEEPPLVQE